MTSRFLALDLIPLPDDLEDRTEVSCPACCDDLEIHQPDEQQPERLLGTCPSCSAWFLIDFAASLMVRLPDKGGLRDASTAAARRDEPSISASIASRTSSRSRRARDGRPRASGRSVGASPIGGTAASPGGPFLTPPAGCPRYFSPRPSSSHRGSTPVIAMNRRMTSAGTVTPRS